MLQRFASNGPQRIIAANEKIRRKPMPRGWQVRYFNPLHRFAISCGFDPPREGSFTLSALDQRPIASRSALFNS
jgi:hypothetical protein